MVRPYTHWAIWNTEDGKKVFADNRGKIMDKATAYETMRLISEFYDNVSDEDISEFNKELKKDQYEDLKEREEANKKQQEREREYKPTYMFIIKKVNEPCYKFKFGGYRVYGYVDEQKRLNTIKKQLDRRLDNIDKESEVPIELVDSFIYVHNAPGIHKHILEIYGSFRDEFDWYVLEDKVLAKIINYIESKMLEV
ncbi:hypothetical protein P4V72_18300 [Bacillus thuringiensis]|uniref:Uncharacterized protein n=1 Tax=Bacillus thuringiensis TaxID=1428 RepID=A0A9W3TIV0_BACTU|nr:hypothetical protein [Bacillus thuringiensis]AQY42333.1 hypothetical protein B4918_30990 [Bacillus thuringiensis]MDR4150304.1 hypothetical protein [Bacillus thuringiensis]MEC3574858.1 hypothetical protein [Bacillus thuringiensis]MED2017079.1 hypothetical protein [Bacillus thuringiensis]MED2143127.1 hypothetical protein [Bacillus thuringiensis]